MAADALKLEQEVSSIHFLMEKGVLLPHRLATFLEKQSAMVRMLTRNLKVLIRDARILEIGSGYGDNLLQFLLLGANAGTLVGNDLLEDRLDYSRTNLPAATMLVAGDARTLDLEFRAELARHLWTLVKPGGGIFWYDFAFNNPCNPDVLKVTRAEVKALFPEARADIERRLAPIGTPLYRMASAFPFLRTHSLGWLENRVGKMRRQLR